MSVTTGTGAKKTAGTDNWRTIISVHDDTVDVYDKVKAAAAIFASAYDSTATYAAGDQCTHDGRWYVANQAISTAEDWTAAHWTEITIASKLDTANVYNGLDKTASGFALDARQGKSLSEAIANIQDGLAIVANGNTHAAIGAGQFVYVKNHGTLADGLYTNTSGSTIAANATLSSSNLTADAEGGLNSLNSMINNFGKIIVGNKNSDTVAVPNNTGTIISTIVLTKGTWVVVGCADWASNENGYRQIAFNSDGINPGRNLAFTTQGISSKEVYQQVTMLKATNGETFEMYARQTSGGNLNVYPYLYAVKVG